MATTAALRADAHFSQAASAGTACLPSPAGAIRLRMRWFGSTISVHTARAALLLLAAAGAPESTRPSARPAVKPASASTGNGSPRRSAVARLADAGSDVIAKS